MPCLVAAQCHLVMPSSCHLCSLVVHSFSLKSTCLALLSVFSFCHANKLVHSIFHTYDSLGSPGSSHTPQCPDAGINLRHLNTLALILRISITQILIPSCHILTGFAFVYFEDERDADDAIHDLHDRPFGNSRRRLTVEWSRQGDRGGPRHRDGSKAMANARPTKTLFVINFDPIHTRTRDIEKHFEPYGKVLNVRIRRNFAFVTFESQEEATKALECTNMSKILDRVVTVEYALRDDGEPDVKPRGGRYDGRRGDSPYRERSVSPVHRRSRPSPDYGRAHSPVYDRYDGPAPYERERDRYRDRSPVYGRYSSRSPVGRSRT